MIDAIEANEIAKRSFENFKKEFMASDKFSKLITLIDKGILNSATNGEYCFDMTTIGTWNLLSYDQKNVLRIFMEDNGYKIEGCIIHWGNR